MKHITSSEANRLIEEQLAEWPMAKGNFEALGGVRVKDLDVDGMHIKVQFNPARIVSSSAKVDAKSLKERKCFLCGANRPEVQRGIEWGPDGKYIVLINPFPIFPRHLTIPDQSHTDQLILGRIEDMMDLSADLDEYTVFYNGPKCGASAPDHMHFQAGKKEGFPVVRNWLNFSKQVAWESERTGFYVSVDRLPVCFILVSRDKGEAAAVFELLYDVMPVKPDDYEPMMNLLVWREDDVWITCIFPRRELRPSCYYAEGDANILISPATVEMAGLFVVPLEKDFKKVTFADLEKVWKEVSITEEEKNELIRKIREEA